MYIKYGELYTNIIKIRSSSQAPISQYNIHHSLLSGEETVNTVRACFLKKKKKTDQNVQNLFSHSKYGSHSPLLPAVCFQNKNIKQSNYVKHHRLSENFIW
jgi:hypothetical protein